MTTFWLHSDYRVFQKKCPIASLLSAHLRLVLLDDLLGWEEEVRGVEAALQHLLTDEGKGWSRGAFFV